MGLNYLMISVLAIIAFASMSCHKSDGKGTEGLSVNTNGPAGGPISWSQAKWFDSAGNLYIADSDNSVIRKVTSLGAISTIAGTLGVSGTTGDLGVATSAKLSEPSDFVLTRAGNMILVDDVNMTIRKITGGIISLIAGTYSSSYSSGESVSATLATFNQPIGIVLDSYENIYVSDYSGNAIRRIHKTTGIITTYAGILNSVGVSNGDGGPATSARLNGPVKLAFSNSWDLYIVDSSSHAIRKVSASTGRITTVVGTLGTSGNSGDNTSAGALLNWPLGIAIDSSGSIYIADGNNYCVRKFIPSTGYISTIAGQNGSGGNFNNTGTATTSTLSRPSAVSLDNAGNLYIADVGPNSSVIVKVDHSGNMTTIAGTGTLGTSDTGTATSSQLNNPFW